MPQFSEEKAVVARVTDEEKAFVTCATKSCSTAAPGFEILHHMEQVNLTTSAIQSSANY